MSRDSTLFGCSCVRLFGCLWIRSSLHSVRFGHLLRCSHKRIVDIKKEYIERNNVQVELIRFRKNSDFIGLLKRWSGNILSRPTCSLLSVTSRHWLGDAGRAVRFGTWPLRCMPFRDIFNLVHSHFGDMSYRDKRDSGLYNSTISSYYVHAVRTVQAPSRL